MFRLSVSLIHSDAAQRSIALTRATNRMCCFLFAASKRRQFSSTRQFSSCISVAIVGSGPAGCYTAKYLQSSLKKLDRGSQIDVFERMPTPYGLVRYGVAPDHPEVKNVQNDFAALFQDKGIRFWGNVQVGRDVSIRELRERYHVVVLAYGCEADRKLGIPGEGLKGVLSAREFVAWYNGHPDFDHIGEQVAKALGTNMTEDDVRDASVVIIGHGNVALDCARVLAKARDGLFDTDLAARALPILGNGVSHITIVGRRGHIQGAFTIKEVRELVKLEKEGFGASFHVRQDELDMGTTESSLEELAGPHGRPRKRIDKLLRDAASKDHHDTLPRKVVLRFLLNPYEFESEAVDESSLGAVVCERTRLEGEPGKQRAVGTGQLEHIPAQLALVSIGYRAVPLPGLVEFFDEGRGLLRHEHGRVSGATPTLGGLYASGWVKRGPTGIIGTNIADAKETVASIMKDLDRIENSGVKKGNVSTLLEERGISAIPWDGFRRIEDEERAMRRSEKQPREKITDINKQLEVALSTS